MTPLDTLANEPRWVGWRNEKRGDRLTKIPHSPVGGKAKADDPATWGTQAAARETADRIVNGLGGGIGIELGDLGADTFLAGIDLDSCLGENGALADWATPFLNAVQTYTEISPSGRGLKEFFYMSTEDVRPFLELAGVDDPNQWGLSRAIPGERAKANHGPGIEVYTAGRFFCVTGNRWPDQPNTLMMLDWPALQHLASLIPPPSRPGSQRQWCR